MRVLTEIYSSSGSLNVASKIYRGVTLAQPFKPAIQSVEGGREETCLWV